MNIYTKEFSDGGKESLDVNGILIVMTMFLAINAANVIADSVVSAMARYCKKSPKEIDGK